MSSRKAIIAASLHEACKVETQTDDAQRASQAFTAALVLIATTTTTAVCLTKGPQRSVVTTPSGNVANPIEKREGETSALPYEHTQKNWRKLDRDTNVSEGIGLLAAEGATIFWLRNKVNMNKSFARKLNHKGASTPTGSRFITPRGAS